MDERKKYLQMQIELAPLKQTMGQAADTIMDKEVSDYPIFVVHKQEVELGIPLFESQPGQWSVHASSLEEFVSKQLIFPEKIEDFKASYKDPEVYLCLFVLSDLGAQFIYVPRKS